MTQLLQPQPVGMATGPGPLTLWGLTVEQLHDAYWLGRGVQCVRPGPASDIDRAADLFMLLEPGRLVLFDLSEFINRLAWHGSAVTLVKVIDAIGPEYRERLVMDAHGFVERIARQYVSVRRRRCRVLLTNRARLAEAWVRAGDGRQAQRAVRALVTRATLDRTRAVGRHFHLDRPDECRRFVGDLVERWSDPGSVIEGIEEIAPSVWRRVGERHSAGAPVVGPAWIGCGGCHRDEDLLIGPAVQFDEPDSGSHRPPVRLRPLIDIDPAVVAAAIQPPPPSRRVYHRVKRCFDVVASGLALILMAPLLALIAIAVVLDDGRPVFFRHRRQTFGGRPFDCLKFRTMKREAEHMVAALAGRNLCDGPQVFIRDDPRVTRIGRFLRRFHLDELPQLWNVLRGEMSLVGPRPSPDRENQFCPAWRELRLSVRPGMTGLWQLNRTRAPGRDFQEWIQHDIEYVRRAGFWLDLGICVRTAFRLASRRSEP